MNLKGEFATSTTLQDFRDLMPLHAALKIFHSFISAKDWISWYFIKDMSNVSVCVI